MKRKIKSPLAVVIIAILVILLSASVLRSPVYAKLIKSGDEYLEQEEFVKAVVEYKKAQFVKNTVEVNEKLELSNDAQKDILKIEPLIREKNDIEELNLLSTAKSVPKSEYEAVLNSKKLIEDNRPMFSVIAAKTAVEMNRNYLYSWLYLGISHLECAKRLELTKENREYHIQKAKEALVEAEKIDGQNQDVKNYLEEIDKFN